MAPVPEACKESMEAARILRGHFDPVDPSVDAAYADARRMTRSIVETLRAARRSEGVLLARWGVK